MIKQINSQPTAAAGDTASSPRASIVSLLLFLALVASALYWAKWGPYWTKGFMVAAKHTLGHSILSGSAVAPPEPSVTAAVQYGISYFKAIWTALVAGLLMAAGVEALVPRRWLLRALSPGRGRWNAVLGGLMAVPCMMCTCCSAPVAVSLRRSGVPVGSALAYWVGNPALNPAVIVFMAFVLPWPWVAIRLLSGVLVVFVVVALVARLARAEVVDGHSLRRELAEPEPIGPAQTAARFLRALGRLSVTLLPEYLVIVLLLGAFRGWLFPVAHGLGALGPLGILLFAVAGTLFVIPTAGEIPIVQGMLAAGTGVGPAAALLITLPAISLPSLAMVGRWFPLRVSVALATAVAGVGVLTAIAAVVVIGR
mgnify:CR=1 FL=1